jgi:threonylcarbamoyladenosine tRNA methylthiotransferase MtaB
MAAPDIITFGCRLNAFESEVMRQAASGAGLQDAVIINTCAVTGEAVRQARQAVRKARRERPDARIIVTGCAAQLEPESFAKMPEVDRVLGNMEKLEPAFYLNGNNAKATVNDIMAVREMAGHLVDGFSERARAFVQIQQGCDHRCTFCIIPFARGNSRSAALGDIVTQVRRLVENGYREVVLTGVDITSYGGDLPGQPSLTQMIRRLLAQVPELPRLRLSSIDAVELDAGILELLAHEERLMPHLHLSLQSGDDMILKRMKRRHSRDDAIRFCEQARAVRPDVAFGADLIAGFPTEDDAMFENTLALVEDCGLNFLHVFPYSERPGTAAARMPQVAGALRKERAARLRATGHRATAKFLERQVGTRASVLIERPGRGHCEHYAPVICAEDLAVGEIHNVAITGSADGHLLSQNN